MSEASWSCPPCGVVKGTNLAVVKLLEGFSAAVFCRELYGRGLIGSLKATTWYQQLQEKQEKAQRRQPVKHGIRVQVTHLSLMMDGALVAVLQFPLLDGTACRADPFWKGHAVCKMS